MNGPMRNCGKYFFPIKLDFFPTLWAVFTRNLPLGYHHRDMQEMKEQVSRHPACHFAAPLACNDSRIP